MVLDIVSIRPERGLKGPSGPADSSPWQVLSCLTATRRAQHQAMEGIWSRRSRRGAGPRSQGRGVAGTLQPSTPPPRGERTTVLGRRANRGDGATDGSVGSLSDGLRPPTHGRPAG